MLVTIHRVDSWRRDTTAATLRGNEVSKHIVELLSAVVNH